MLAGRAERTEAREVKLTDGAPCMLITTKRSMLAKSASVPRALSCLAIRVDVKI